ncbi:MAG: hypothetical protein ACOX2K_09320 [Bacillota bacterium]
MKIFTIDTIIVERLADHNPSNTVSFASRIMHQNVYPGHGDGSPVRRAGQENRPHVRAMIDQA